MDVRLSLGRIASAWRVFLTVVVLLGGAPCAAFAHPLGNFTTNHLTRLHVTRSAVNLRYILDLAEIPTVALAHGLDSSGQPTPAQYAAWAAAHGAEIAPLLELSADGTPLTVAPLRTSATTRPGAAGLRTVYFVADYRAGLPRGTRTLSFHDGTEAGRIGWTDVVLDPAVEPTRGLRVYPGALVGSPRHRLDLAARIDAQGVAQLSADRELAVAAAPAAPSVARMNALSDVLANASGSAPLVILGALLLAVGLGALHALEPGHGKTLLAVSLVGARATPRQALILAAALTIAHTIGVLALGAIVLFATRWIVPETIYPWITLASGLFVAALGARALAAELRRRRPLAHEHVHVHDRAHPHTHDHLHGLGVDEHAHAALDDAAHARAHAVPGAAPLTFRTALFAAASGNLAPCPAALVVLLAAISLHRIAFGMALIVTFSIGLAATLTILGIAVVQGAAWLAERRAFAQFTRWAPFASAGAIALVGAVMVGEGLVAQGVPASTPIVAGLTLAAILGYAFTVPHRHLEPRTSNA